MARVVSSIFGVILFLLVLAAGALYVSVDTVRTWPSESAVQGLTASIEIRWTDQEVPHVRARSIEQQYTALGYVHGLTRTWSVALWRQTALGRLSEWFGSHPQQVDKWVRALGLAVRAQKAYAQLPAEQQLWLEAYARGMNAAFRVRRNRTPELLLLELRLDAWEPWHALAIEQLVAWLGTGLPRVPRTASAETNTSAWLTVDRQLREWTRLHDFNHSAAWVVTEGAGRSFAQRHVYGSSARSLLTEVTFTGRNQVTTVGSVPGTIMMPAGRNASYAWAVFPTSTARVDSIDDAGTSKREYDGILSNDASEEQLLEQGSSKGFRVSAYRRLEWPGFDRATDFSAWHDIWQGGASRASFALFDGNGLLLTRSGDSRVLGDPGVVRTFSRGTVVGHAQWVDRLVPAVRNGNQMNVNTGSAGGTVASEIYSPWADTLRAQMISLMGSAQTWPARDREALRYVRNWEGTFDGASIGASIFDTWLAAYADSTGSLPHMNNDWSTRERIELYRSLGRAVAFLVDEYGPDMSRWRWEIVQPSEQHFPVWTKTDVLPDGVIDMAENKYAPVVPAGGGHPSTLRWGASTLAGSPYPASAAWEASISTSAWQRMYVRQFDVPVDGFLQRYLTTHQYPRTIVLDASRATRRRITLQPAGK